MCYNGSGSRGTGGNIWSFPDPPAISLPPKLLYYVIPYSRPFLRPETPFTVWPHACIISRRHSLEVGLKWQILLKEMITFGQQSTLNLVVSRILIPSHMNNEYYIICPVSLFQSSSTCSLWRTTLSRSPPCSTRCHRARASTSSGTSASRRSMASTTPSAAPTQSMSRCCPPHCHRNKDNWWETLMCAGVD